MEPWDGLDVEQQDLNSFKKCNSLIELIPGLVGNVRVTMINCDREDTQNTQEFARDIVDATYERDFKSNP